MNTLEELMSLEGIGRSQAEIMINAYRKHIKERHGDYEITDMTYVGNQERDIELTCTKCNTKRIKRFVNRRNKLSELPTICPECRNREKEIQRNRALEEKHKALENVIQNNIGKVYGDFKLIKVDGNQYVAKCERCGLEQTVSIWTVINNKWKRTKCTKHYERPIKYDESYIGRKNNKLTVIGYSRDTNNKKVFICECDCGNIKMVSPTLWEEGITKSCGCIVENLKTSPEEKRLKSIFRGMIGRCYNANNDKYHLYGKRGISICDEWLEDRQRFIDWALSHGYRNDLTIDRIDVNGNYEPDNCRWATYKEQANNRRPSSEWDLQRKYEYKGEKYNLKDFAAKIGKSPETAKKIYKRWVASDIELVTYLSKLFSDLLTHDIGEYKSIEEVHEDFEDRMNGIIEVFTCLGQQPTKNQKQ